MPRTAQSVQVPACLISGLYSGIVTVHTSGS